MPQLMVVAREKKIISRGLVSPDALMASTPSSLPTTALSTSKQMLKVIAEII
jgi:hypothetical protein